MATMEMNAQGPNPAPTHTHTHTQEGKVFEDAISIVTSFLATTIKNFLMKMGINQILYPRLPALKMKFIVMQQAKASEKPNLNFLGQKEK